MLDKLVLWTFGEFFFWRRFRTLKDWIETGTVTRSDHFHLQFVVQTLITHASLMAVAIIVTAVRDLQVLQYSSYMVTL